MKSISLAIQLHHGLHYSAAWSRSQPRTSHIKSWILKGNGHGTLVSFKFLQLRYLSIKPSTRSLPVIHSYLSRGFKFNTVLLLGWGSPRFPSNHLLSLLRPLRRQLYLWTAAGSFTISFVAKQTPISSAIHSTGNPTYHRPSKPMSRHYTYTYSYSSTQPRGTKSSSGHSSGNGSGSGSHHNRDGEREHRNEQPRVERPIRQRIRRSCHRCGTVVSFIFLLPTLSARETGQFSESCSSCQYNRSHKSNGLPVCMISANHVTVHPCKSMRHMRTRTLLAMSSLRTR